ncbi:MAG: C40 family peptidase [Desulfobacterales bacterium]|nr:C40 family peptidase [Desulfobacterales bacterium]MBS3755243.1 C40 family peptidase [Desulfobacterales bacterium]
MAHFKTKSGIRVYTVFKKNPDRRSVSAGTRSRQGTVTTPFSESVRIGILAALLMICLLFSGGCTAFRPQPGIHVSPVVRKDIVNIALQHRNTPYQWKEESPGGFDCSGFVQFVYRQAGFAVPRTSTQQFRSGYEVSRSNLKKGDLVFFKKWKWLGTILSPSHVGIYIGQNRFIHSPSPGGAVRIDDLDSKYWKAHYKGARILLE